MAKRRNVYQSRPFYKKLFWYRYFISGFFVVCVASPGLFGLWCLARGQAELLHIFGVTIDGPKFSWLTVGAAVAFTAILTPIYWWGDKNGYINIEKFNKK